MEFRDYIKPFKKYLAFILLLSLAGAAIAFVLTIRLSSGYTLTKTYFLATPASTPKLGVPISQTPQDYAYEGYYAQEKARNFTDSAVAILESNDFKLEVTQSNQSLSVRKVAPQIIRLTTVAKNPEDSQNLMDKSIDLFNGKSAFLSDPKPSLILRPISSGESRPSLIQIDKKVTATAGLFLGFAFAIFVISLKTYFKI